MNFLNLMSRINNVDLIREIINEIKNIRGYSDLIRIKDDLINKLEILEKNIGRTIKERNNNFGEYLYKANEYISQYKPQNGFSSGYSNLFHIPHQDEISQNYNNEYNNNYNKINGNNNLNQNKYQTIHKNLNEYQMNNINYQHNLHNNYNYPNKTILNIEETETPIQLSPPKKIEYNSIENKSLLNSKNSNNYFNPNQNQIYKFNDDINDNKNDKIHQYLKNKNKTEYKFIPSERIDPEEAINKGKRITNIIMKINEKEEIYDILKQLFNEDLIDKMMDPYCPENYITKIEESIKQIEFLQKQDEEEKNNKLNEKSSHQQMDINQTLNNKTIINQKKNIKTIPKRCQLKSRKDNLSSSSLKKNLNNNNSISNNNSKTLNNSKNYSYSIKKPKSYADKLLLSHGFPIGFTNEDNNNNNSFIYKTSKNKSFNK